MKLLIKQRVFSWTDTYDVYDETGQPQYFVKAEFFSIGHKIHIYNRNQQEVGVIHQKLFTFLPQFEIEQNGQIIGTIQKKFNFFTPRYEVDYNGWSVEGDFLGWEYNVLCGNNVVMHITKEVLHWGDTYVLDYVRAEEELQGLLLVIAIDAANCSNDK